jgi:hypothetical protein
MLITLSQVLSAPSVANYTTLPRNTDAQDAKKTVTFKTIFGLLNQPKFIPLQFGGLILELELVTSPDDAVARFFTVQAIQQLEHTPHLINGPSQT